MEPFRSTQLTNGGSDAGKLDGGAQLAQAIGSHSAGPPVVGLEPPDVSGVALFLQMGKWVVYQIYKRSI